MERAEWPAAAKWSCLLVLPWTLFLAGCGGNSDSDVAEKADRSLESWSATVRLGGEQWAIDRIPATYLRQILDSTNEALDDNSSSIKKISAADPRRQDLQRRVDTLRERVKQLSAAAFPRDGGRPS